MPRTASQPGSSKDTPQPTAAHDSAAEQKARDLEIMRRNLESMRATLRVRSAEATRIVHEAKGDLRRLSRDHSKALVKLRIAEDEVKRLRERLAAVRDARNSETTAELTAARQYAKVAQERFIAAQRMHAEREFRLVSALEDARERLGARARRRPLQLDENLIALRKERAAAVAERDAARDGLRQAQAALKAARAQAATKQLELENALDAALAQVSVLQARLAEHGGSGNELSAGETSGISAAFSQARRLITTLRTDVDRTERELRAMRAKAQSWFERWQKEYAQRQEVSAEVSALQHKLAQAAWRLRNPSKPVPPRLMRGAAHVPPAGVQAGLKVLDPGHAQSAAAVKKAKARVSALRKELEAVRLRLAQTVKNAGRMRLALMQPDPTLPDVSRPGVSRSDVGQPGVTNLSSGRAAARLNGAGAKGQPLQRIARLVPGDRNGAGNGGGNGTGVGNNADDDNVIKPAEVKPPCPAPYVASVALSAGRTRLDITNPCAPGKSAQVTYGGLRHGVTLGPSGAASLTIDGFFGVDEPILIQDHIGHQLTVRPALGEPMKHLKVSVLWQGEATIQMRLRRQVRAISGGQGAVTDEPEASVIDTSAHTSDPSMDGRRRITITAALAQLPSNIPLINELAARDKAGRALCLQDGPGRSVPAKQVRSLGYRAVLSVPGTPPKIADGVLSLVPCVRPDDDPWIRGAIPDIVLEK